MKGMAGTKENMKRDELYIDHAVNSIRGQNEDVRWWPHAEFMVYTSSL